MDRYAPRDRRGAHRTRRDLVAAALPSLLAVAAVGALVTALYVWRGEDADHPADAASRGPSPTVSREPVVSSPATSEPSEPSTSAPPPSAPGTTVPASKAPSSAPASSRTAKARPATTDLQVVVLNQTTRRGLAASVADSLEELGFDVAGVGNFRGVVPSTTVYYPPGTEADALVVARALPTEPRVRPRFGNLSTTRLTVVLTRSYPY